jgi:PAS domain S-box-containing protein
MHDKQENQKTILLVEDEAVIAMIEEQTLKRHNFNVIVAPSGEKAVNIVKNTPNIDLILMDINLGKGKMDGTEAAEIILKDNDIPILFLSSYTQAEVVEKTERITSYGYVVKDSGETVLITSIKMAFKLSDAHQRLKESEKRVRLITETIDEVFWMADVETGKIFYISPSYERIWGRSCESLYENPRSFVDAVHAEDREHVTAELEIEKTGLPYSQEYRIVLPDGNIRHILDRGFPVRDEKGQISSYAGIAMDITDRKRADDALRESKERFGKLAEQSSTIIWEVDAQGIYTYVSHVSEAVLGYCPDELVGRMHFYDLHPESGREAFKKAAFAVFDRKEPFLNLVNTAQTKDGRYVWLSTNGIPLLNTDGTLRGYRGSDIDISDQRRAEEAVAHSHDLMRYIIEHNRSAIAVHDRDLKYIYVSQRYLQDYGVKEKDIIGKHHYDVFPDLPQKWRDVHQKGLAGEISSAEDDPYVREDGSVEWTRWECRPWYEADGSIGGIIIYTEVITDRKQAENKLQDTLDSLRKAFGTIIQVMVSAVESRDPYTAGHQLRSSDLARSIAIEMGLSQDKIDGISMAGSIHDIGKLSIPAEILSKPTKLSEIELPLVRQHAQKGYDMLKDVESPWPLAEMVYQHHERMDGSGYPRRLKGEEILIEARILAVADVVEAMASHRPYRPSLGLEAALAEIENNKGTLYDADAVDACLRLFREKGFQFD